ncbi:GNAT family N-acetyltransferase [Jeotgalibacillus soli]|uniref:GNAT family N-acetyltransferase n=1 Tax=Jeotgalibacillus soli TaxID=889306 RepID=UPI000A07053C
MCIGLFHEAYFNKGYGTEALKLLDYGFGMLNLHRIELDVYNHNDRGMHVYKKIGFKQEGILRVYLFINHRYYDLIMMSIGNNTANRIKAREDLPGPFFIFSVPNRSLK